jgi:hypothetical protein
MPDVRKGQLHFDRYRGHIHSVAESSDLSDENCSTTALEAFLDEWGKHGSTWPAQFGERERSGEESA